LISTAYSLATAGLAFWAGYTFGTERVTTYASSMGMFEPVTGLMKVDCVGEKVLWARSLGIAGSLSSDFDILVEVNDVPADAYSPTTHRLKKDAFCKVYVTNAND
jgi:hypothetical protein